MIKKNKIVSLTIIGVLLGGSLGAVANSAQIDMLSVALLGGIVGFLAGWIWNTRSDSATE